MTTLSVTGVEVRVRFFPLAFFLFFCTPRIEIDGVAHKKYWGTHFFELAPGSHTICIYFRYIFMSACGRNSISVNVEPGKVTQVSYYMPPWMLAKGSIRVTS